MDNRCGQAGEVNASQAAGWGQTADHTDLCVIEGSRHAELLRALLQQLQRLQ